MLSRCCLPRVPGAVNSIFLVKVGRIASEEVVLHLSTVRLRLRNDLQCRVGR